MSPFGVRSYSDTWDGSRMLNPHLFWELGDILCLAEIVFGSGNYGPQAVGTQDHHRLCGR